MNPSRSKPKNSTTQNQRGGSARNPALDVLRGLAVVLMVVDHICWLFGDSRIAPDSIRIITRLSMPLFCVLTGYLALAMPSDTAHGEHQKKSRAKGRSKQTSQSRKSARKSGRSAPLGIAGIWDDLKIPLSSRTRLSWLRLVQVCVASCILNFVLQAMFDSSKFEILASLIVCYLSLALIGRQFCWLAFAWLLFPVDVSVQFLDYPLSAVASCMAVGVMMRVFKPWVGVLAAFVVAAVLAVTLGVNFLIVTTPTVYVLLALPVAATLLSCCLWFPKQVGEGGAKRFVVPEQVGWLLSPLRWVGQHPLKFYVAQYLLLLGLAAAIEAFA